MNLFITMGTFDFLKKFKEKYPEERFLLMENEKNCLLLHETEGQTLFKSPRNYEVIDAVGILSAQFTYAVLQHFPVTDEGCPIFEYRFNTLSSVLEGTVGLGAVRVLRPLSSDTYIILTLWENAGFFKKWQHSETFAKTFSIKEKKGKKLPQIFPRPSYISRYSIEKEQGPVEGQN
nr:antibiotic biosynthesis monooxygenase [uncultured Bacillus sp.]